MPGGRPGQARRLVCLPARGLRRQQQPRTPSSWLSQQRLRLFLASALRCCRRAVRMILLRVPNCSCPTPWPCPAVLACLRAAQSQLMSLCPGLKCESGCSALWIHSKEASLLVYPPHSPSNKTLRDSTNSAWMLPVDPCMISSSSTTGGKLEKGPAALLSCLEGILRISAPLPGGSLLSPGPHASMPRLARSTSSTSASPVRPPVPQQAPLPGTPGTVVMEDDPPG